MMRGPASARDPVAILPQRRAALAPMVDPLERGDRLSAAETRACAWRPCGREFTAPRLISAYCCADCRKAANRWRNARGGALVGAVLDLTASRKGGASDAEREAGRIAWRFLLQRGRDLDAELASITAAGTGKSEVDDDAPGPRIAP
jgi:hypothetical protein